MHLGAFQADGSHGDVFVQALALGVSLTRESLCNLAHLFSALSGIQFPRDYTRRRALVLKWFDDHVEQLEPLGCLFSVRVSKLRQTRALVNGMGDSSSEGED
jgi:hypothetical protein